MASSLTNTGERRIYLFADGKSEGNKKMKELLGGKGANLCEMSRIGLRVPPGFVISTAACEEFYAHGGTLPAKLMEEIRENVAVVERCMGKTFGDVEQPPLLFSVRSGAAVSMPGMMDTVLNLGLTDTSLPRLSEAYGARFANDCMRRLLQMFGDVVLGIPHHLFETRLSDLKKARGVHFDVELTAEDLAQLIDEYKEVYRSQDQTLPQDPWQQLQMGVHAVFGSWNSPRAIKYREINKITGLRGTAVNIQCMVYGNINNNSGTGVCFTRNPANGKKELFGEYLANAQGEDVVAGIRTPVPIAEMARLMPEQHKELVDITTRLEAHMRDMQDVEFTVQDGVLFMLQCRSGKRTGTAALQVACDMFSEGLVTSDEAICMVEARHLTQLLHPTFADEAAYRTDKKVLATGLAASPGAAVGRLVFSASDAEEWHKKGELVILVRQETSPEDVGGMHVAQGILTARGGMTSHAAVVARGWGKPCVCGVEALHVDADKKVASVETGGRTVAVLKEGEWVSLNGTTGEVILGQLPTKPPEISGNLATLMTWVDARRKLGVQANADTPEDALVARKNGAEGIGLCRTEHMFFSSPQRIAAVRRMIAATELQSPQANEALEEIKAFQREDFEAMFTAMDGLPVTIRLLDPPLHEFLPHAGPALRNLCRQLSKELHTTEKLVKDRLEALNEANPMMGLRGCRLGVVHPEISMCQAVAIFEAASAVIKKGGKVFPHIMIPLVGIVDELETQAEVVRRAAHTVSQTTGVVVPYKVGSMIEVPRAALLAGALAKAGASFFSFGTNDLTQMTFGISRDDAQAHFLTYYQKHGLLATDPFETVDTTGVGELIKLACERGRAVNPSISLGVCGEHGGDPQSIDFFARAGLDYVSCSPLRVPIARLSAAQAAVRASKK